MAFITKQNVHPLGEFKISFSTKTFKFQIEYPSKQIWDKITHPDNIKLDTWEDVLSELNRIKTEYLEDACLTRQVIIIQLKTSESTYELTKDNPWKSLGGKMFETKRSEDYLNRAEGFGLVWIVANEYEYGQSVFGKPETRYEITDHNKNYMTYGRKTVDIIHRLLSNSDGEFRILDYRKDLHEFLKSLEGQISIMLQKLISYFDIDNEKFIQNFEQSQLKLLNQ